MRTEFDPEFGRWSRRSALASFALILAALAGPAALAQERTACLGGAPGAPSIYIDSSASEVTVFTTDGRAAQRITGICCFAPETRFRPAPPAGSPSASTRSARSSGLTGTAARACCRAAPAKPTSACCQASSISSVRSAATFRWTRPISSPASTAPRRSSRCGRRCAGDCRRAGRARQRLRPAWPAIRTCSRLAGGEAAFRSASVPFQSAPIGSLPPPFRDLAHRVGFRRRLGGLLPADHVCARRQNPRGAPRPHAARLGRLRPRRAALDSAAAVPRRRRPRRSARSSRSRGTASTRPSTGRRLRSQADPNFAPAHVAASYVRQATGDLEGALTFARSAVETSRRTTPMRWRGLPSLQMVIGDRPRRARHRRSALAIERIPLALFVDGLARLAASHYAAAEALFEEAIALDQRGAAAAARPRAWPISGKARPPPAPGRSNAPSPTIRDRASLRTWLGRGLFRRRADQQGSRGAAACEGEPTRRTRHPISSRRCSFTLPNRPDRRAEGAAGGETPAAAPDACYAPSRGLARGRRDARRRLRAASTTCSASTSLRSTKAPRRPMPTRQPGAHRFLADAYRSGPATRSPRRANSALAAPEPAVEDAGAAGTRRCASRASWTRPGQPA